MSYLQCHEMKIIRRKHKIVFSVGVKAESLLSDVRRVPPSAVLTEINRDDEDGTTTLIFVEEQHED